MSRTLATDRIIGAQNEQTSQNKLETFLNCTLTRSADRFAPLDYHNAETNTWAETKRRFCNHNTYDTVIIGKNKVDFLRANGGNGVFCWNYNDGDYVIRYDPARFETYEVAPFQRRDRGGDAESLVYHIPTADLSAL